MTIEQLREMHLARPFQPFDIHLADGRTLTVDHPEFLSQSRTGRTIYVTSSDDRLEIVDLLLVVSLKLRPAIRGAARPAKGPVGGVTRKPGLAEPGWSSHAGSPNIT